MIPPGFSMKNIYAFCIHSNEIDNMIKHKFFIENSDGYKLNLCFRGLPQQSRESLIDDMLDKELIDEDGASFLKKKLPETFQRNWNASEGFYLYRKSSSKNSTDNLVIKSIISSFDFSKFPSFPKIRYS